VDWGRGGRRSAAHPGHRAVQPHGHRPTKPSSTRPDSWFTASSADDQLRASCKRFGVDALGSDRDLAARHRRQLSLITLGQNSDGTLQVPQPDPTTTKPPGIDIPPPGQIGPDLGER